MRYSVLWYAIGCVLLAVTIFGSLTPVPRVVATSFNDKFIHFLVYFVLMGWFGQLNTRHVVPAAGIVALGFSLELIQGQTRYRMFDWYDVLANTTGVVASWLILMTPFGQGLYRLDRWLQRQVAKTR
jgi:glycopeptide antibiotics resistance protein